MTTTLNFAALDVETANPKYGSICSIGVAIVRNGTRVSTRTWLCRPPAPVDSFNPVNVGIHGITAEMVANQPSFAEQLRAAVTVIDGLPVIAHNATFDMAALVQACDHSRIPVPTWEYGCTRRWAKQHLPHLPRHGLKEVAAALGTRVAQHHEAGADAAAAADIAITIAARVGAHDLAALAKATGTRLGALGPNGNIGCR
ncbi:exonuclease domain-containing protein [Nocardia carnea]|uniref:exonuclease domain-containing protein n=1 Tax=Nocardia carnea TaxID=37328 RepID=UPI002458217D|nr:exonuclease domain-containing protein [Nocardia carnea]